MAILIVSPCSLLMGNKSCGPPTAILPSHMNSTSSSQTGSHNKDGESTGFFVIPARFRQESLMKQTLEIPNFGSYGMDGSTLFHLDL
jgi:hypothetical protein